MPKGGSADSSSRMVSALPSGEVVTAAERAMSPLRSAATVATCRTLPWQSPWMHASGMARWASLLLQYPPFRSSSALPEPSRWRPPLAWAIDQLLLVVGCVALVGAIASSVEVSDGHSVFLLLGLAFAVPPFYGASSRPSSLVSSTRCCTCPTPPRWWLHAGPARSSGARSAGRPAPRCGARCSSSPTSRRRASRQRRHPAERQRRPVRRHLLR